MKVDAVRKMIGSRAQGGGGGMPFGKLYPLIITSILVGATPRLASAYIQGFDDPSPFYKDRCANYVVGDTLVANDCNWCDGGLMTMLGCGVDVKIGIRPTSIIGASDLFGCHDFGPFGKRGC